MPQFMGHYIPLEKSSNHEVWVKFASDGIFRANLNDRNPPETQLSYWKGLYNFVIYKNLFLAYVTGSVTSNKVILSIE